MAEKTAPRARTKPAGPTPPAPGDPPEFTFTAGAHNEAMENLSLRTMAARLPAALAQTARMAWRIDPVSVTWLLAGQILAGACTAAGLAGVADAMGPLLSGGTPRERLASCDWRMASEAV
ncbi:ABC transporter ATP-binding protein, partial [Streptomyces sp. NPDC059411]